MQSELSVNGEIVCQFAGCGFKTVSEEEFFDHSMAHLENANTDKCSFCGGTKPKLDIMCKECDAKDTCVECDNTYGRHYNWCKKVE